MLFAFLTHLWQNHLGFLPLMEIVEGGGVAGVLIFGKSVLVRDCGGWVFDEREKRETSDQRD